MCSSDLTVEVLNGQKIQSSVGGTPVVFANDIVVSGSITLTGTIDGVDLSVFEMPANADPAYYRFAAIKAWVDGENDCRTGFMYEPYVGVMDTDPPGGKGTLVTDQNTANAFAKIANQNQKASMLHCSGDAAADIGLNTYATISKEQTKNTIKRIEHFGMFQLTPKQLERAQSLKKNNLHISVQPIWLLELVNADYENMGTDRAKTGFQFKTLINAGLEPAASTDMTGIYLGNIDPFKAIYEIGRAHV